MNGSNCRHGIVKTDCESCTTEKMRRRYSLDGRSTTEKPDEFSANLSEALDPNYGLPVNRVLKIINYTVHSAVNGVCEPKTSSDIDRFRREALEAYLNDPVRHMLVLNAAVAIMELLAESTK